jgi:hypothetical protein
MAHLSCQQIDRDLAVLSRHIIRVDSYIAAFFSSEYDLKRIDIVHLLGLAFLCSRRLAAEVMESGIDDGLRDVWTR